MRNRQVKLPVYNRGKYHSCLFPFKNLLSWRQYLRWSDAVEQPEVTWPEVTWPEGTSVTWRDVTSITCPVRKYVLPMRNRKLRNIRPSVAFWPEVTSITWPEEALSGSVPVRKYVLGMPGYYPRFFLSSSNIATECDRRSLDPFGVPLGVRMRNRKFHNTRSARRSLDPFGSVHGCSLRRPRPITIGNLASYI